MRLVTAATHTHTRNLLIFLLEILKYSQHQRLSLGHISRCIQHFTTWIMKASIAASSILSASTMLHVQIQDTFRRPSLLRCCGQNLGKIHFWDMIILPKYLGLHTVRISTNASKHPSSIHRQIDKSYIQTGSPFLVKPSDLCDLHRKSTAKVASSTLQFWFPAILKRQT